MVSLLTVCSSSTLFFVCQCGGVTFTFIHLANAFIQSDLQCIQAIHFCQYVCSLGIEPTTFTLLTQCSTTEPQEHDGGRVWERFWAKTNEQSFALLISVCVCVSSLWQCHVTVSCPLPYLPPFAVNVSTHVYLDSGVFPNSSDSWLSIFNEIIDEHRVSYGEIYDRETQVP